EKKGIMFITHDIEVALTLADKIAIFNEGETVEVAHAHQFTGKGEQLHHPYTRALWNALPQNAFSPPIDLHDSRSEEHTSELQSRFDLVCRLLLEKKNN